MKVEIVFMDDSRTVDYSQFCQKQYVSKALGDGGIWTRLDYREFIPLSAIKRLEFGEKHE